jgi:hypothetical protein
VAHTYAAHELADADTVVDRLDAITPDVLTALLR